MKTKIINIIPHPPAYGAYRNEPRPEINWDTPDGSWVGIWGYDWADIIGNEVLKVTDEFEYEVWQPDLRADKIYCHRFENGLVHKLFPASNHKKMFGLKITNQISSKSLLDNLDKISSKHLILHLNNTGYYINQEIIDKFYFLPKIIEFHSKLLTPYIEMKKLRKNILTNILYYKRHKELLRNKKIIFVYNNSKDNNTLLKYNNLGIKRIFMGCDFNYWKSGNREEAKKHFGATPNTKVFSMASRFVKLKQIDKIIKIFTNIDKDNKYNFKLLIGGHGEREYENYLKSISSDLLNKEKLLFTGYLLEEEMLKFYQASDMFISASTSEGGPTSVVKAIACEIPVMCTKVGGVDDILSENKAGVLIDPYSYKEWKKKIIEVIEGKEVSILDREIAKEIFHWPNIAKKFINIYRRLNNV